MSTKPRFPNINCLPMKERTRRLRMNLKTAATLVDDSESTHPEYLRALSEQTCTTSGINTDHKDSVGHLIAEFSNQPDPSAAIDVFIKDIDISIELIGTLSVCENNESEYVRALAEHACYISGINGDSVSAVIGIFQGVLEVN